MIGTFIDINMNKFDDQATKALLERNLITGNQYEEITSYRNLNIFSLNAELKLFLYLSVLLFTSGIGVLIYNNIDSIGHIAILSLLLIVIVVSFYFCFKKSKGFQKQETTFEHPVLEYLVLAANILTCVFIGYLQFQYEAFGTHYGLATLIPTVVSFFCAYYFDNKSVLTIAITGLAAYIGLSVTPQDLLHNVSFYYDRSLSYSAVMLGVLLILWTIYSSRIQLKTHFKIIYLTFALHIISIAAISNLINNYYGIWVVFAFILTASTFYFYKVSYETKAISLYVFMIVYAYIGLNIFLFRLCDTLDFSSIWELFILILPVYFIGSIVLFIKLIKTFNKEIAA
ncbi:Predicted membrane protein [Flavobacterium frigidimaris]|nr:Predicted membrane protein [Flavobacterium frigidimaris]